MNACAGATPRSAAISATERWRFAAGAEGSVIESITNSQSQSGGGKVTPRPA